MKKSVQLTTPLTRVCLSFTALILFTLSAFQLQAQQNPYPFNLDLSLGGGLIGDPNVNATLQPELGFSYMPGKLGIGLNAGLLSYAPAFDAQQYASGFEEYTSISSSNEKWSSFFLSLGPRFEFGSNLPVTFRSSLDLSLTHNSPPSVSVDFNDPDGSAGDLQLQLSGYEADDDYSKWSAAIRPEFQMQFTPGGSDRFAITVATGIQHRLSQNEFTYSQRDLSEVRVVPNSQEMFMQFEMAPEIQQTAQPPKTNFFTTVGIKIKFGKVKHLHNEEVIHRDIASRASSEGIESGDCDDSDSDRCLSPGEIATNDSDSDADGLDDGTESKLENSGSDDVDSDGDGLGDGIDTELLQEAIMMAHLGNYSNVVSVGKVSTTGNPLYTAEGKGENVLYEGEANNGDGNNEDDTNNEGPSTPVRYDMRPSSYCMELSTMRISTDSQKAMRGSQNGDMNNDDTAMATSHNASRSNRSQGLNDQGGDTDIETDSTDIASATSHNASRSNRSQGLNDQGGDTDVDADSSLVGAQNHNSSRSNRTSPVQNEVGDNDFEADSDSTTNRAQNHNSSRSNRTSPVAGPDMDDGTNSDSTSIRKAIPPKIHGIAVDDPNHLKPNTDQNGFPVFMENASLTITKRKRPGRATYGNITLGRSMNDGGDLDGDGLDDASALDIDLQMGDPDSDDDGLMDAIESATYSISKRSARTGRNTSSAKNESDHMERDGNTEKSMASDDDPCGPGVWARTTGGNANCTPENSGQENPLAKESGWQETPVSEVTPPGNVHQWTYKLNALSDGSDMPGNGTLTVIVTGGKVHFNIHFDPDSDEDGYSELLQNSTFSISKRSARTGARE